ncbi:LLM class flavin-dependent oxidoreductase [Streptomyces cyaneus]|uniref:LLM class flavin-dependent oxidoreductase n=1 Tax=Streptomyces cyaneus TaxID=1904 RepID=UPI0013E3FC83|nr:LLM class flavin-dependent oxidoreductase [Streptomyces cyaneus]
MELGILSLSDLQTDPATGTLHDPGRRTREIVSYAIAADQAGLDVFGLGEHHSPDFAVVNPAVPLAAIAQATSRIRLASAVSVLSTADPVRLHQDFASLDLLSDGRAEIIAGRSAFTEAFRLFGIELADYDDVFTEKLRLLLAIRENPEHVTWSGRFRPALEGLPVPPRPQQSQLPLWLGVGGTTASVERAGYLGLPMTLGLIGGDIRRAATSVEHYRAIGTGAGHRAEQLRLAVSTHFYIGKTCPGCTRRSLPLLPRIPAPQAAHRTRLARLTQRLRRRIRQVRGAGGRQPPGGPFELLATEVAPAIRKELGLPAEPSTP